MRKPKEERWGIKSNKRRENILKKGQSVQQRASPLLIICFCCYFTKCETATSWAPSTLAIQLSYFFSYKTYTFYLWLTAAWIKGKFYMMVLRPAIMYGFETVALTKREVVELEYKQKEKRKTSEQVWTWKRLVWQRKMQGIGWDGHKWSAVVTPKGRSYCIYTQHPNYSGVLGPLKSRLLEIYDADPPISFLTGSYESPAPTSSNING